MEWHRERGYKGEIERKGKARETARDRPRVDI